MIKRFAIGLLLVSVYLVYVAFSWSDKQTPVTVQAAQDAHNEGRSVSSLPSTADSKN